MLLTDKLVHVTVSDNLAPLKPAHDGVAVPELVIVRTEYGWVKETVLAIQVNGIILYRGTGQDELIPCLIPQLVHGPALLRVV